ncbi:hypothetical protein E3P96_02770 [Wallemia ichthyophaga]|nr:hypothetical protein E3P96_02770 [Wallemia ichthyophaga]
MEINNKPAYEIKEEKLINHSLGDRTLHISQDLKGDDTTGSTLWLSAQLLSAYIEQSGIKDRLKNDKRRCLELGSGVGLVGLALANNKSNEVLLTDVSKVVDRVLLRNVKSNDYSNTQVGVLDWSTEPEAIDWKAIRCFIRISDMQWLTERRQIDRGEHVLRPPFDLIVTTDTLYERTLTPQLLKHISYHLNQSGHSKALIGLERRDSALIDEALSMITGMGLKLQQIPQQSLSKAVRDEYGWQDDEIWSGCELYKLSKSNRKTKS